MKILITGTTGYIAKRLALNLLESDHQLVCCVRDLNRIPDEIEYRKNIEFLKIDFLTSIAFNPTLANIDIAYYLIHSMATDNSNFEDLEKQCAQNFREFVEKTMCRQVIYLSGIANDDSLSKHLKSRLEVEKTLQSNQYALTTLRAGIIVGSGSASFEIIRDIVEKIPIMITPKWLNTKTQPIAIRDVLQFLEKSIAKREMYNCSFDIYGPEVLTYRQMLLEFARVRNLKRFIITLPILTPKLSSYWLYFVTRTSFNLAMALVDSMKVEVIARKNNLNDKLQVAPISYSKAVQLAFQKIEQNDVISSWKDAMSSGILNNQLADHIQIPKFGCFKDVRQKKVLNVNMTLDKIWSIGGENGWYSYNWLWQLRGYLDKLWGGVGLRRGRTHQDSLEPGDPLDFWRVLLADKKQKRLILFAEMKLPGEAWLEFKILDGILFQTAVFRPIGIWGRLYWFLVLPFHTVIFGSMIKRLAKMN